MIPETPPDAHWIGVAALLAFVVVVGLSVSLARLPEAVKRLVYAALALRVVGTLARHYMVVDLYGAGDSMMYFEWGVRYSDAFWSGDLAALLDSSQWSGRKWWGTQFLRFVTGGAVALFGETFLGGFLLFSLLAFMGLVGFAVAYRRAYPDVPVSRYALWAWLFPSLWFWPSAIGKEALILCGLGIATWGYAGRRGRIHWLLLGAGLALVFAVRVQVAAVFVMGMLLAQWLAFEGRWTLGRAVQGLLILTVGLGTLNLAADQLGMEDLNVGTVGTFVEENSGRGAADTEATGTGSAIGEVASGIAGVPVALVNIMARPFLWEARNRWQLLSALEIFSLWVIVWFRRRNLLLALRHWRGDRLLRLALSFVLLYSILLGMVLANLGLIARQRIFLFPFLFLVIEAAPRAAAAAGGAVGRWREGAARPRPALGPVAESRP
jgi:hypothetical protein